MELLDTTKTSISHDPPTVDKLLSARKNASYEMRAFEEGRTNNNYKISFKGFPAWRSAADGSIQILLLFLHRLRIQMLSHHQQNA